MTLKNLLLVINPQAGKKKANRLLTDIVSSFNRAGYRVTVYVTACKDDATMAVQQYAEAMDLVVCCGGDGTFNETVSGVIKSNRSIPIGYIPAGSTNDFASSLALSTNISQAVQDIIQGTPIPIDMGCFNGRYFSYVASFGAFTKTSYATPQSLKNALGHAAYLLSGISELSQIRARRLRFILPDGNILEDDFIFGAVTNATSMAGILKLSEEKVDLQDGLLELMLIRSPKDLIELSDCIIELQKQSYNCPMITFLSIPSVTVQAPADLDWTIDGEHQSACKNIEIYNLHHAVQVIRRENKK